MVNIVISGTRHKGSCSYGKKCNTFSLKERCECVCMCVCVCVCVCVWYGGGGGGVKQKDNI